MVIEAGWRSGSLNSAHHAEAIGRPVGAVPGPVTSAASAGCHRLLRESVATLVTNAEEMAALVTFGEPEHDRGGGPPMDPRRTRLLDALSERSPRTAADLAARSGLSIVDVHATLGALELAGEVRERERGWVVVRAGRKER